MDVDVVAQNRITDLIAAGLPTTSLASSAAQPIALTPASYNMNGNIALNDVGVIKIGTAPNTSGAGFIQSTIAIATSNFHSFEDTSQWTPSTGGLGAASFNAGIIVEPTANAVNHVNGFQYTGQVNATGTTAIVRGFNSTPNVDTGTVTSISGLEVADPVITNGGVVTGMYAFNYGGTGTAGFNWGVYQSGAASTAHGPWNYMNGPLGLGVAVPNKTNVAIMIAPARFICWGTGNGATPTAALAQTNSGVIDTNVPTILGKPATPYTVATLPAASAALAGAYAYVTDATGPTYLGALTGGGAVVCPVFCNGTSWVSA